MDFIWLASYPRSGNFLARTILFNCFNIKSAAIYPNDCDNKKLSNYIGHLDHFESDTAKMNINFPVGQPKIVKTHHFHNDNIHSQQCMGLLSIGYPIHE